MLDRPTQDAFAVKLRAHQRAVQDRDAFDAAHKPAGGEGLNEEWRAYESIMSPLHSAVFDTGKAVMLETATAVAALIEKRAIRSEEHTSELQSLMSTSYAVIFLQKTKKQIPHQ